jgi:hypothetical protein
LPDDDAPEDILNRLALFLAADDDFTDDDNSDKEGGQNDSTVLPASLMSANDLVQGFADEAEGRFFLPSASSGAGDGSDVFSIYLKEPSSVIAFTLSAPPYTEMLTEQLTQLQQDLKGGQTPRQTSTSQQDKGQTPRQGGVSSPPPAKLPEGLQATGDAPAPTGRNDIDLVWRNDTASARVRCTAFCAPEFHRVRHLYWRSAANPGAAAGDLDFSADADAEEERIRVEQEQHFIASLARCKGISMKGGMGGMKFYKTNDSKYLLKEITAKEQGKFLVNVPAYLNYMMEAIKNQRPTCLCKIFGAFGFRACFAFGVCWQCRRLLRFF